MKLAKGEGLALLVLGGAAVYLFSSGHVEQSAGTPTGTAPGGFPIVPTVRTGAGPSTTWDAAHFAAIIAALVAHNAPANVQRRIARAFLSHQVMETGRTSEYNHNPANLHPSASWHGAVYLLPGARPTPVYQRAYADLASGENDYVAAMTGSLYAPALIDLANGNTTEAQWWTAIRAAGWTSTGPNAAELATFQGLVDNVRAEFPG